MAKTVDDKKIIYTMDRVGRAYGTKVVLKDISISYYYGAKIGVVGANGAGKSTIMNIITGCLAATDGTVTIDGFDILENPIEAKKKIGYLPEIPPVYVERTVREYLKFVSELKKLPKASIKAEVERVMEAVQIKHYENRLIKHLSKGYRQRVGIAEALLGDPEVIILDEPTVGLDPQQIIEIRELISSLRENHTVILSSHILSEVQAVCDMILVINHGHIIALDTPENLEKVFAPHAEMSALLEGGLPEIEAMLSANFAPEEISSVTEKDGNVLTSTFKATPVALAT